VADGERDLLAQPAGGALQEVVQQGVAQTAVPSSRSTRVPRGISCSGIWKRCRNECQSSWVDRTPTSAVLSAFETCPSLVDWRHLLHRRPAIAGSKAPDA